MKPIIKELVDRARQARENAHCPFSQYSVGAAILTRSGNVYAGCNVENASFSATICAERVAIGSMVASGEREIDAVVVVTRDGGSPCGVCRQVIAEFSMDHHETKVYCASDNDEVKEFSLAELLPECFTSKSLKS